MDITTRRRRPWRPQMITDVRTTETFTPCVPEASSHQMITDVATTETFTPCVPEASSHQMITDVATTETFTPCVPEASSHQMITDVAATETYTPCVPEASSHQMITDVATTETFTPCVPEASSHQMITDVATTETFTPCVPEASLHQMITDVATTETFTLCVPEASSRQCHKHDLVHATVSCLDKCKICLGSGLSAFKWIGFSCKVCSGVWHKDCLQQAVPEDKHNFSSEDNQSDEDMHEDDMHKDDDYVPDTDSESDSDSPVVGSSVCAFTQDVQLLHTHLEKTSESAFDKLKKTASPQSYADLAKSTLARIIIFNRRRAGEVSKMRLKNFIERDKSPLHADVSLGLTKFEKKLCEHFSRVEIRGKRGREVAVLLTPYMVESLNLLVSKRMECGVPDTNIFLFARPQCSTYYSGQVCLRLHAEKCGAKKTEYLRSTQLRKHVATLSQILSLKENELDQVADFLGHDIRVHREHYRLPEATIRLAKISKMLIAMDKGCLGNIQGKSLDEIQIEDQIQLTDTEDDAGDEPEK
ncbi:uncharacterized protein [Misgurnus anguillicaudatus]